MAEIVLGLSRWHQKQRHMLLQRQLMLQKLAYLYKQISKNIRYFLSPIVIILIIIIILLPI